MEHNYVGSQSNFNPRSHFLWKCLTQRILYVYDAYHVLSEVSQKFKGILR